MSENRKRTVLLRDGTVMQVANDYVLKDGECFRFSLHDRAPAEPLPAAEVVSLDAMRARRDGAYDGMCAVIRDAWRSRASDNGTDGSYEAYRTWLSNSWKAGPRTGGEAA
jgi:hypothetical protein